MKRNMLLLSNSSLPESSFLEWAADIIKDFLSKQNVKEVLFIPYALSDLDAYSNVASSAFKKFGYKLTSIHKFDDPVLAVQQSQALFVGGGNTFRLLKMMYDFHLIEPIRKRVLQDGLPYIGSSAGTNVSTRSIHTTNDMPIVYPPSFEALGLVPFNINPHYIDPDLSSTHMGETREQRIMQYHEESSNLVIGLREGCLLHITDNTVTLRGPHSARIFTRGQVPKEFESGADLSFLLKE